MWNLGHPINQYKSKEKKIKEKESIYTASTFSDPILTEQESFLGGEGGSELEHAGDKGQSPQEQPSEVSPHEYVDTFISSILDDSGTIDLKPMA